MPVHSIKKSITLLTIAIMLLVSGAGCAQGEMLQVSLTRQEAGSSYIVLPQLSGHPDAAVQEQINAAIYEDGGYAGFDQMLSALSDSGTGLQLTAEATIIDGKNGLGLLSILLFASGKIGPGRPGYRAIPLMYDLSAGRRILPNDVFFEENAAQTALDELVAKEVEPAISDYLSPEGLYPVPISQFLIDESGITFYYEQQNYTTLAGRSGAVNFHWDEIAPLINRTEGSYLSALALNDRADDAAKKIEACVTAGSLPGLPVRLGDSMEDVLAAYPELHDSETFSLFEKHQLEDARFRETFILAEEGLVSGILSTRMNLWGVLTGSSMRDDALGLLGQPAGTLSLDEASAMDFGLEAGTLDSYRRGDNELRLHYDKDGLLKTIWLVKADDRK